MIFIRAVIEANPPMGNCIRSRRIPSTRIRTRIAVACGSMWMSLAPWLAAVRSN